MNSAESVLSDGLVDVSAEAADLGFAVSLYVERRLFDSILTPPRDQPMPRTTEGWWDLWGDSRSVRIDRALVALKEALYSRTGSDDVRFAVAIPVGGRGRTCLLVALRASFRRFCGRLVGVIDLADGSGGPEDVLLMTAGRP